LAGADTEIDPAQRLHRAIALAGAVELHDRLHTDPTFPAALMMSSTAPVTRPYPRSAGGQHRPHERSRCVIEPSEFGSEWRRDPGRLRRRSMGASTEGVKPFGCGRLKAVPMIGHPMSIAPARTAMASPIEGSALLARYHDVRRTTERLCRPLAAEDH